MESAFYLLLLRTAIGLTPFLILMSGLRLSAGEVPRTRVGEQSADYKVYFLYLTAESSETYLGLAIDLIAIGEMGERGSKFLFL